MWVHHKPPFLHIQLQGLYSGRERGSCNQRSRYTDQRTRSWSIPVASGISPSGRPCLSSPSDRFLHVVLKCVSENLNYYIKMKRILK